MSAIPSTVRRPPPSCAGRSRRRLLALAVLVFPLGATGQAQTEVAPAIAVGGTVRATGAPYQVDVWAEALFGTDGSLQRLDVPEADQYPAAFVQRLKQHFAKARIPPVTDDQGAPATFLTGLGMYLTVTPGADAASGPSAGTVRIDSVRVGPRPVKRYAASAPENIPTEGGGTAGVAQVSVQCTVQGDGRCTEVSITKATAGSESLRRWAVASMEGWRFEPQRVNGVPVPSQWQQTLQLEVLDTQPRDFRNPLRIR